MASNVSKFVWYDVMTTDIDAAEEFYGKVVGWQMRDSGMPGQRYTLLMDGDTMVGGIMGIPGDADGMPPMWMGYIGVDDVDAKAKEIAEAGGKVHRGPQDVPGVGRFAVVSDPHGAGFMIFSQNAPTQEVPFMAPRSIGWRELHAGDREEATAFYAKLFGWRAMEAHDMGSMIYQTMSTGDDEATVGIMTKMADAPHPFWAFYIAVDDFDAAVARVTSNGGTALMEPHEVPGGAWILPALDPQGAHFSLIGMRS
ncbi:MAG TPA: VOC family protein [Rhizobiaceae bacterium]|nr:VOC family protein [Rhizobiaceae bacterium]